MSLRKFLNWKRIIAGIAVLTAILCLSSYFYIDRELGKMYGEYTQIADIDAGTQPDEYAITNVNVLAPSSDNFRANQTVLVRNGVIASVSAEIAIADVIKTVDGKGMFLVPGYTDSHVHLWKSENDLLLYLANGVTQIREMNGSEKHLRWKKEIAAGRLGPDMYVVAPQLASFGFLEGLFVGWTQNKTIVNSADDVEDAVQSLKAQGYDAIKASSFLNADGYRAISASTRKHDIPLVGHIPLIAGIDDLLTSNQQEVAHVEELTKAIDRDFGEYTPDNASAYLEHVRNVSDDLAERLREKNIAVTTTLTLSDGFWKQKADLEKVLDGVELAYVNPGIAEGTGIASRALAWLGSRNMYRWPEEMTDAQKQRSLIYWQTYTKAQHIMFAALLRHDVTIFAGTDANVPVMVPGFSLHGEMEAMHADGMSAPAVLASATRVPGHWMGMKTGEVSAGYKANLVLLRENPLENIGATDSIESVFVNGHVLSRRDLDGILSAVKTANDKSRHVQLP